MTSDKKKIRRVAMNMLARREYSSMELKGRLWQKFENSETVTLVVDRLKDESLQSDARYIESFVRSRIARGQGLRKIEAELLKNGIEEGLLRAICSDMKIDWNDLAKRVVSRKLKNGMPRNQIERSKIIRFLQYRGFTLGEAMKALEECGLG